LGPVVSRNKIAALSGISFLATAAVAMVVFAPEAVARHMPLAWERKLGAAFEMPIEATRCADPAAQVALDRIVDRLDPKARSDGFTVELADVDIANAAALPGGRMIVLNGLFEDVDNADAIAGIVAHEIAHVRRRHVAAGMVRQLGMGTIVTLLGGGAVASNAGGLLSLKFTRSAEAEADSDAIAMLAKAGIDPRPTAAAFEEFRKQEGDWPEWLGDHPASAGRAKSFAASYGAKRIYQPVLGDDEAKSLMSACR
jgi:predicted Zn-dependent protease